MHTERAAAPQQPGAWGWVAAGAAAAVVCLAADATRPGMDFVLATSNARPLTCHPYGRAAATAAAASTARTACPRPPPRHGGTGSPSSCWGASCSRMGSLAGCHSAAGGGRPRVLVRARADCRRRGWPPQRALQHQRQAGSALWCAPGWGGPLRMNAFHASPLPAATNAGGCRPLPQGRARGQGGRTCRSGRRSGRRRRPPRSRPSFHRAAVPAQQRAALGGRRRLLLHTDMCP